MAATAYAGLPSHKQQLLERADVHALPRSYRENSAKEETELEYVENFRRQFVQLFPRRRELLLCPINECGVRKFVCSTVRPTNLSVDEVYDMRSAASFVADFFDYLPLENSTQLPDLLPSPGTVIQLRAGDCLDLATVLVSLLRGVGFDAYVVAGHAPLWITQCDQTAVDFDATALRQVIDEIRPNGSGRPRFGAPPASSSASGGSGGDGSSSARVVQPRYQIKVKQQRESKFLALEREAAAADAEKLRLRLIAEADEQARASREPLYGKRVHCWVMVRASPQRAQPIDVYIEPTTGVIYSAKASPYLGIDAVWNERNYWVNVQHLDVDSLHLLNTNVHDTSCWEFVLLEARRRGDDGDDDGAEGGGSSAGGDDAHDDGTGDGKELFDAPPSWCHKLVIPRAKMQTRFPSGHRLIAFNQCVYERWAPHHARGDGLVCRVRLFFDVECEHETEVHEYYANRRDGLRERRTWPLEARVHCSYDAGRAKGVSDWIEYGQLANSTEPPRRVFQFHAGARVDGLVRREEVIGVKVIDTFAGRDDHLVYRSATIDGSASQQQSKLTVVQIGGVDLAVRKFAEKFSRNADAHASAEDDVAKISYLLHEGHIRLDFHCGADRVTASRRLFAKDQSDATGWSVDALHRAPNRMQLRADLQAMIAREKDTLSKIREHERSMHELLQQLRRELADVPLHKSVYDAAREKSLEAEKEVRSDADDSDNEQAVDVLAPYLQQFGQVSRLSYEQAKRSRDECLKALRDRLLERAAIIQSRLDEENEKLQKKQQSYQRQGHGEQEDEEMSRYYEQAIFKIHILQARIQRHEETALRKYTELEQQLRKDSRLRSLYA